MLQTIRTDIFKGDIEELFKIQDRLERHLNRWESNHSEYSHSSDIISAKEGFILQIKVYEEQ